MLDRALLKRSCKRRWLSQERAAAAEALVSPPIINHLVNFNAEQDSETKRSCGNYRKWTKEKKEREKRKAEAGNKNLFNAHGKKTNQTMSTHYTLTCLDNWLPCVGVCGRGAACWRVSAIWLRERERESEREKDSFGHNRPVRLSSWL